MKQLQLHNQHKKLGAQFINIKGWEIPSHYNDITEELYTTKNNISMLDRSYLGKIMLTGNDALDLMNRISTNDMNELIVGAACNTVFCTPKGRIIDYVKVLKYDEQLLLISSYLDNNHLIQWINRFIILEDVQAVDVSNDFLWLTLLGPNVIDFIQHLSGQNVWDREEETIWIEYNKVRFPALLNDNYFIPVYNFCLPLGDGKNIFYWISKNLKDFNGMHIGDHVFQIIRVESGKPEWGSELTEEYNPHEARLIRSVSFTKGCYTGQEVIARLDTYDKVQKYLMIIDLDEQIFAEPPFDVFYENEMIGVLTSYAFDPITRKSVGLGYIKKNLTVADFKIQFNVIIEGKAVKAGLRSPPVL